MSINAIPLTDDTISNFGRFLPALYIERVEIYDDKMTLFVSVFLLTDLDEDTDTMLLYLSDKLNFYVMHAWKGSYEAVDTDTDFGLDDADWDLVIDGKMNVFAAYDEATQNGISIEDGFLDLSETDPLVVFVPDGSGLYNASLWTITEDLYDDKGNPIIKAQIKIDYEPTDSDGNLVDLDFTTLDFWNVFAFASMYEYDASDIEVMLENPALLDLRAGDVSYERVFKDGELQHKIVSFVDADDLVYSDVPIQSITGPYYKTDNITRDDMVEYFEEFVTGFKEADTYDSEDDALNKMLDDISYVVEEYSESTQFLKEMDLRRAFFTSKDPAEPVGKLYTRFRKRIYTANRALENGTQVKKILNRNPKIVDLRGTEDLSYESAEYDESLEDTYIYSESFMSRNSFGYSSEEITGYIYDSSGMFVIETIYDTVEDVVARNRGYFFFDYEKAFRQTAIINSILDISKLSLLGVEATPYDAFKITEASITRTQYYSITTWPPTFGSHNIVISCEFNDGVNYPLTETVTVNNESSTDDTYALPNPSGLSEFTAETFPEGETDYLILRNFVPRQTDSISSTYPDYRLACFEFQDFYDYEVACDSSTTEYSVKVTIEDRTIEVARALITYYQGIQAELEIYYDAAADDLSSNDAGDFNNFFSEGATAPYSDDSSTAPWIVAPAVYCIFKDIIYNTYGGDIDKISAEAQKIIDGIDPYTGNLFVLETFKDTFDDFYDDVLSDSGEIGSLVDDAGDAALTLEFDGTVLYDSCSSEAGCDGIYPIVEEVVEEDEDGDDEDESIDWDTSPTEIDYDVNSTGVIGIDAVDIEQILNEWEDTFGYTAFPEDGGDHDTARENIKDEIEAHLTAAAGGHLSDWATDINYNENTTIYTNADGDIYKYKVRMNTHTWYVNIQERTPV